MVMRDSTSATTSLASELSHICTLMNSIIIHIADPEPLEGEVDAGGWHGLVVVGPFDEKESDTAYVGGGRLDASQEGALLDDHLGTRQVDELQVVSVNDELDLGHGGR